MYGKVFVSMYEGTLYGHWQAIVAFQQMIVLCDADGIIDMTPQAIAARTSIPLEIIQEGIKVLEQPDEYTRTPGEDGKRIVRLDGHRPWGWRIVNHHVYRDLVAAEEKRRADRERIAGKRAASRNVSHGVAECRFESRQSQSVANVAHTEADTEAKKKNPPNPPLGGVTSSADPDWWSDFRRAYPTRAGDQGWRRAQKAAHARQLEGHTTAEFIAGAQRYAAFCEATDKIGTEYVKQAATFLGPDKPFLQAWALPATKADIRFAGNLAAVEDFMRRTEDAA